MSSESQPVLSLEDVDVHFDEDNGLFGGTSTVQAVNDVSLDIAENDVVALVGESGCGKTTLGKTAIGLQRPTDGSISYRGQDIWDANDGRGTIDIPHEEIRRSLQIIHQDPGSSLNPHRTIIASLADPLKRWQPELDIQDRRARIYAMLEEVDMTPPEDYAERYPHQLSGGEKQRIALIRALLMNPAVILADEAVSALDVSLRVEIMDIMLDLQGKFQTSFIFVSHNFSNARYLAQRADGRIGVMYLGELVEIGPVEEILTNPKHPYTKALLWAAPKIDPEKAGEGAAEDPPLETIDIPDPIDPPSGCRFHTRCPKARDACKHQTPALYDAEKGDHEVACFRQVDDHVYWRTEEIHD